MSPVVLVPNCKVAAGKPSAAGEGRIFVAVEAAFCWFAAF